jgi:hypothetical protein
VAAMVFSYARVNSRCPAITERFAAAVRYDGVEGASCENKLGTLDRTMRTARAYEPKQSFAAGACFDETKRAADEYE